MAFNSIEELRIARNQALARSDFLMFEDIKHPPGLKDSFIAYRQQLRDLPQRVAEIGLENVELPIQPF